MQASVIPLLLINKDVCVKACTGSGKTLAFAIPVIQTLLKIAQRTTGALQKEASPQVPKSAAAEEPGEPNASF